MSHKDRFVSLVVVFIHRYMREVCESKGQVRESRGGIHRHMREVSESQGQVRESSGGIHT